MIEMQLVLHQIKDVRDILKESLRKRKNMAIQKEDTKYQEPNIAGLFDEDKSN